jgi:murein DD-endopeptidase MepM/ murein hydrolase activator NlpD
MVKRILLLALTVNLLFTGRSVAAQSSGPVYIVQTGDTLYSISARFNISIDDLMTANNITDPNLLAVGQQLVIPGLEGVTGTLDTEIIAFGDSFNSLMRRTQIPIGLLRKLNHVVSPTEFYVGASMIIPKQDNVVDLSKRITPDPGESLFELALKANTDPWTLSSLNDLNGTWDGLPGDVLYTTGKADVNQSASGLPPGFVNASIPSLPFKQGGTAEIIITPAPGVTLSGELGPYTLHFFPMGDGRMVALQGLHAMLTPGIYPFHLDATLSDSTNQSFEQSVLVASGNYPKEALSVSSELIDPSVTGPEDKQVESITSALSSDKYWQSNFSIPVYVGSGSQACIYDWFGTRRSFNGSDYIYFHSGIDYGVCFINHPLDIYAAAPGKVIFTGPLTVRGNATFIDHGWGVYSAYYHQKEVDVTVGQQVQTGQLIGLIGATGRVTGPHLHWEIWVNGIQVNPLDWLNNIYP